MAALPEPIKSLRAKIEAIAERVKKLENAASNKFSGTGLSVPSDGVTQVDGSLVVQSGDVQSGNYDPATAGWHLGSDGKAEFKDVTLYDLPNSMLASPVSPVTLHADASNFGPTTSGVNIMTVSATVPAGYTKALLIGLYVSAFAQNTTASTDFLYANVLTTPATAGWQIPSASCAAGNWASAFQQGTLLISGLSGGGTVTVQGQVSTASGNWTAQSSNVANLDVAILWLR